MMLLEVCDAQCGIWINRKPTPIHVYRFIDIDYQSKECSWVCRTITHKNKYYGDLDDIQIIY